MTSLLLDKANMGIAHFLTTSEGEHHPNPRHGKRNADALADAQRALKEFPRRKRENRSAKRRRAVEEVAKLQEFECAQCGHTANADQVGALSVAIRAGLVLPDVA